MEGLLLVLAAISGVGAASQIYASAPQGRGQYQRRGSGRNYYGYNTGDGSAKVEVRRPDGSVVGSYRYFDPSGKQIVRSYIADSRGFRILGNDLPIGPDTPAAAIAGAPALTAPVEGADRAIVEAALDPNKRFDTVDIQYLDSTPRFGGQQRSAQPGMWLQPTPPKKTSNYLEYPSRPVFQFPAGFAHPGIQPDPPIYVVGRSDHLPVDIDEKITAGHTRGDSIL